MMFICVLLQELLKFGPFDWNWELGILEATSKVG